MAREYRARQLNLTAYLPSSGYSQPDARMRIRRIIKSLDAEYPDSQVALRFHNPFQLLIAVILSAQTTDVTVNKVTRELFKRWPTAKALASASTAHVEEVITPTGFFRQKTRSIIATATTLETKFGGEIPLNMKELTSLPGVGRKTANVVLANLAPYPASDHGIYVDTHIRRTSMRLGLTGSEDPVKIELNLMKLITRRRWADLPHRLILLGRGPCEAKRPRCPQCPLLKLCPTGSPSMKRKHT